MPRLNQIIAVEKGIKSQSFSELTDAHHAVQKPALLSGISRTYRPKDEEGETLPSESAKSAGSRRRNFAGYRRCADQAFRCDRDQRLGEL